ncbi:MAG TPA: AmmeMemoRadiSam system protein B [Methylomirabilota bacterium]|nr:AmmeMemoRadiSam system protein B [Methylomirabilota bacterium]
MTRVGNPRLRAVEAFPVEHEGQRCIALRDPAGFTDQIAVLPGPLLDLVSLFDGEHPIEVIREVVRRRHGEAPSVEQITALVERLDDAGFLESDRFEERRRATEDAFRRSPVRAAAHAGGAYAGEADELRAQIAGFFAHADGPGSRAAAPAPRPGSLSALIAPHIDFHRGGPTYAWAYQEVLERSDADLFVILGTCHAGMADPFAVTLKPYDTPLGPVAADRDFYDALSRRAGQDLLASEPAHRAEHSIEFQAVMLQSLVGGRRPFTILPVLASYLHEAVWAGTEPEGDRRVPRFLDALRETIAASTRRVCLVAGVDLAHVGPRFGDPDQNTEGSLATVERADRAMLESVVAGDARGFFDQVAADRDARRICGLSPIYSLLRLLPEGPGRLLQYRQWPDPEGAVTFCAVGFP